MQTINIYLTGVGGQGIGLISEVLLRAADHANLPVNAVDTHGLAQRGGIVISHLRIGRNLFSPLIADGQADIVIAMERHEALRAVNSAAKDGATLIYYDTVWQPLDVRLDIAAPVSAADIEHLCAERGIRVIAVNHPALKDVRMQNVVLLAHIDKHGLIAGVRTDHYRLAMDDLMAGRMLENNLALFESLRE